SGVATETFQRAFMFVDCRAAAAVFQNDDLIITIVSFARSRVDNPVCRHPAKNEPRDPVRPKDQFKRRPVEWTDAVFDDVEVLRVWRQKFMDLRTPGAE